VGIILKIISWILVIGAFASLGFLTDNPTIMVPAYMVFFFIVFGATALYVLKHQKRKEPNEKFKILLRKIIGVLLSVIAVVTPAYILKGADFPDTVYILLSLATLILIGLCGFAINFINKSKKNIFLGILGYFILIAVAFIPGMAMQKYDPSYSALGTAYYAAVLVSISSWWGISLFFKTEE